jgi:hypothetical protein
MMNVDEMIGIVRAAFEANADAATKQRAAQVLRAALMLVDPGSGDASGGAAPAALPALSAPAELLGSIVERFKPYLPPDLSVAMPRLNIPLVAIARSP